MTYDVNDLKDRAQCLDAKAALEAELDGYNNRDQNQAFRDRKEGRTETTTASQLAKATSQVDYLNQQLAASGLSAADRTRYEGQLLTATYQKNRLTLRSTSAGGVTAFLADVDVDQVDAQVTVLTAAIAAVQARHDALPA